MTTEPRIIILYGGRGGERDVSLVSGEAVVEVLEKHFEVELHDLREAALPAGLDPDRDVCFLALHGDFGENGELQALLEGAGLTYSGSGPEASRLCMDKWETKQVAASLDVSIAPDLAFQVPGSSPAPGQLIDQLAEQIVFKPRRGGSSIGLRLPKGEAAIARDLAALEPGDWLAESFIPGREISLGLLEGKPLGVVEIVPAAGVYDYDSKYQSGGTIYHAPADLPENLYKRIQKAATEIAAACGIRDFARIDFRITDQEEAFFLEVNTLPGLTTASLLPKSAACLQISFEDLLLRLVKPAIQRFKERGNRDGAS